MQWLLKQKNFNWSLEGRVGEGDGGGGGIRPKHPVDMQGMSDWLPSNQVDKDRLTGRQTETETERKKQTNKLSNLISIVPIPCNQPNKTTHEKVLFIAHHWLSTSVISIIDLSFLCKAWSSCWIILSLLWIWQTSQKKWLTRKMKMFMNQM